MKSHDSTKGKRRLTLRWGGILSLTALLAFAAAAFARDLLTVVQRETAIRQDKRLLSPKVATVREGDQVAKLGAEGSWYRVEFEGVEGWLPSSAVSSDRKVVLSGQAVASGVRATEQSAGARGFNPEVEARHRASRGDLAQAYRLLDRIQETKFSEERITRFVQEGKLGGLMARADPGEEPGEAAAPAPAAARPRTVRGRETPPWKR